MGDALADLRSVSDAARRAADTLLRVTGGQAVQLRVPTPAVAGDVGEQLGLATPGFEDLELAPAVFRKSRAHVAEGAAAHYEVLVSAECVEALAGGAGASTEVLFAQAYGVVAGGDVLEIEAVTTSETGGAAYVYRLLLRGPIAAAI